MAPVHPLQYRYLSMAGTSESGRARRSSADLSAKRQAGRYVLGDLLGRGGMAEVFAGHSLGDHGFQKPVAIKRLLPELANDKVFVDRLIGEAKLLVGMTHGNVVSVIDLARDGEDVFLVMDFVDGPSLRQLLKARGSKPLPLGISSYIVQSACAGLEFAHARPGGAIIHADISPSNLLLTTSGEVRVADFGIARREGGGFGIVEGKWAYMAPEQARGEPLTPRSDVFALGVVLYELITGAHPFGRQVTAEERESGQMRVIPPRIVKPSVPHGLDAICMRALAHDPRERYASMQKLADAIMDERFTNQWRDGASDLAKLIAEAGPSALGLAGGPAAPAPGGPRTMVTDRPVTLFTRSLIDVTPPGGVPRRSAPRVQDRQSASQLPDRASQSQLSASASRSSSSHVENHSAYAADGADVSESMSASRSASASVIVDQTPPPPAAPQGQAAVMAKLLEMPGIFNPNGSGMPQWQLHPNQAPAQQELDSVHGGTGVSAHGGETGIAASAGDARSNKWAISVMALAAVLGVIAAVVMQTRSKRDSQQTTENTVATTQARGSATAPPPTPDPVPPAKNPTTPTTNPTTNPSAVPTDPNAPMDLTTADPTAPIDLTKPVTPQAQTPTQPTTTTQTQTPTTTTTQTPAQTPTIPPSDELPKLTDPQTTAPDETALAKKKAEEAEREAEKKKVSAARVSTTQSRPNPRRDRDDDEDEDDDPPPKRSAKPSDDIGFLRVSAWPSGWVSVDGGPKKAAPTTIQVPAGKHKVKIFTDFESKIRTVTIEGGQVKIIKVDWDANAILEDP